MTKHTPGPWSVVEHDHAICVQTESPKKSKFSASRYAVVGGFDRSDPKQLEEARANARLIAAAPELLDALKAAQKKGSRWHPADPVVQQINVAIAKATGA